EALREQCEQRAQIDGAEPEQRRRQQQREIPVRASVEERRRRAQRHDRLAASLNVTAASRGHASRTRAPTLRPPSSRESSSVTSALHTSPASSFTCQRLAAPWYCTATTTPAAELPVADAAA